MTPTSSPFDALVDAVAARVLAQISARSNPPAPEPALLNVKDAATYLGRSEQAVQHMIFSKELPVVRKGRRVHLRRSALDIWIEQNTY
jgi:excisionase family DNA binding protein